jgi:phosphoribosylanthranilate isomerase
MKVKICGITNVDDAVVAADEGADYIGFIFADSPRKVAELKASEILAEFSLEGLRSEIMTVGVFVNQSLCEMKRIVETVNLDFAQIHGDETADECNRISIPWYRALRVKDQNSLDQAFAQIESLECPIILADALSSKGYGGTGGRIDTDIALRLRDFVKQHKKEFFLAGGITPENVRQIIDEINPDGIDVASGVEERPGKKSYEKIQKLFSELRIYL